MADDIVNIEEQLSEQYDERGFFRRLGDMFSGFKQPKTSREYKLALLELQRLKAPIIAIIAPVLGVIVLIVVTAVTGQQHERIEVEISSIEEKTEELEEPEPEPEELDMTEEIDVTVDVVTPQIVNPAPPSPSPGGEPDKVATIASPVTMSSVGGAIKRGIGDGDGGGFGTLIKGGQNIEGALIGVLIDLKRDGAGNKIDYSGGAAWGQLKTLANGNFSSEALSKFYVAPNKVALTKVYIPALNAEKGPECFGAKDFGGSGWCAYYTGELKPTEKARYRFVGYFDEFIIVRANGKVVLEASWGHGPQSGAQATPGRITGWVPSDKEYLGKWKSWQSGATMVVGDWFQAEVGKPIKVEIALGETMGGLCGGLLVIQKEGEKYEQAGDHLALPVFASRKLSVGEKDKIASSRYKFALDSPVFNGKVNKKVQEKMAKEDVSVEIDI